MIGQFELGSKHIECIKKTKEIIKEIKASLGDQATPKKIAAKLACKSFGFLPSEKDAYNDYLGLTVSMEEIAKQDSLLAFLLIDQIIFREILKNYSQSSLEDFLKCGETVGILCLEPAFTGLNELNTTVSKTSDGNWAVKGVKLICDEQLLSDRYLIFANDEEKVLRLFLVCEHEIKVKEVEKNVSASRVVLNQAEINCTLKNQNLVAATGDNFENILAVSRTLIAAVSLGIAHSALITSIESVKETKNSKGEAVSTSQNIQFTLADMFSQIEASRMLTYYSADSIDKGKPNIKIATMAKIKATDAASKVSMDMLHLLGNIGFIANSDFASLIQKAVDGQVKGGTNRTQRAQIYKYMLAKK